MANEIYVQRGDIKKKADKMQKAYDKAMDAINDLYNNNLYKLGDEWKDKTSYEFINRFSDYLDDLNKIMGTYGKYISMLRTVAKQYEQTVIDSARTNIK